MEKKLFGAMPKGEEIFVYTLESDEARVEIINFGATVTRFSVFSKDIIGGFSCLEDYLLDTSCQGATVGRVANRIEDAQFVMDGAVYMLPSNDGESCLHGGVGFHRRVWTALKYTKDSVTLGYYSEDGEEGFPSGLAVKVKFTLVHSSLIIEYVAVPEGKTPIALTNHSYFNLNGFGEDVLSHTARIYARNYTEVDERLIPTGNRPSVINTVFDFTVPKKIGEGVSEDFIGYDHNFVLSPEIYSDFLGKSVGLAATVESEELVLNCYTDQPGIQFYIANFLSGKPDFRGGIKKIRHGGFCLEAQTEPNCIKKGEGFYDAGEVYRQTTVYEVKKK